jgi:hypothetical protein
MTADLALPWRQKQAALPKLATSRSCGAGWTHGHPARILRDVSELPTPKRLFRAMKPAPDQRPLCGSLANELGVRPKVDIAPDAAGQVHPETGGLSTTPDNPNLLPPHVRPVSLGGRGKLPVFVVDVGQLGPLLAPRRDPKNPVKHAFIEPGRGMALSDLQELLCRTRVAWEAAT